jgi:hypothetical protein
MLAQLLERGAGKITVNDLVYLSWLEPAMNMFRGSRNRDLRP